MEQFWADVQALLGYTLFSVQGHTITAGKLLMVPLIILIFLWLIKWSTHKIVKLMERRNVESQNVLIFRRLYFALMLTLLVFTILALLNVPLAAFAFVSGALAIGIGFGAQNILNNFISGWILIWERPIRVNDFLEIDDVKGTVETINTRSTRIRRVDGVRLMIPNSKLLENTVVNWTLVDRLARACVRVGVEYGSPVRKVSELITQAADEHPDVIKEPEPLVIFEEFGDSALNFDLYFWIEAFGEKDLRVIKSDVRFAIVDKFREQGIVIAFPQRDVHLDGHLKISRADEQNLSPEDDQPS